MKLRKRNDICRSVTLIMSANVIFSTKTMQYCINMPCQTFQLSIETLLKVLPYGDERLPIVLNTEINNANLKIIHASERFQKNRRNASLSQTQLVLSL